MKLLGKKKIRAIIKHDKNPLDMYVMQHHENTQRVELTKYETVRSVLNIVATMLEVDMPTAKKIIHKANNIKKNKVADDGSYTNRINIIQECLELTGSYDTISTLANNMSILNIDDILIASVSAGKISMPVAEYIYNNKKKVDETKYKKIIDQATKEELELDAVKALFATPKPKKQEPSKRRVKLSKSYAKIEKLYDDLSKSQMDEIDELMKKIEDVVSR